MSSPELDKEPFKQWCAEVYTALCQKHPNFGGKFDKSQVIDMFWEVKEVDASTASLIYDRFYIKYYKLHT